MKRLFYFLPFALMIACSPMVLQTPTQSDADRAAQKFPGVTLAELNDGKAAYEANCAKCHKLVNPTKETEEKWRQIVPPMAKKAKVDAHTEELILKYVVTMSNAGKK